MRIAIIINDVDNESLLRFTETKLFFNAKNQAVDFFDDCYVASSWTDAENLVQNLNINSNDCVVMLETGTFLTTTFIKNYRDTTGVIKVSPHDNDIILFDKNTYVGFNKRCNYPQKSKQLYIIENMLQAIISAKKTVYLENTEPLDSTVDFKNIKHFYGLAAGWKSQYIVKQLGLENLESVTIFDINQHQLEYAKSLHSLNQLPSDISFKNCVGQYKPPNWAINWWSDWNRYPVKFDLINLLDAPSFPDQSLIWTSNVFCFEPTIFQHGWQRIKEAKEKLIFNNKKSIIINTL